MQPLVARLGFRRHPSSAAPMLGPPISLEAVLPRVFLASLPNACLTSALAPLFALRPGSCAAPLHYQQSAGAPLHARSSAAPFHARAAAAAAAADRCDSPMPRQHLALGPSLRDGYLTDAWLVAGLPLASPLPLHFCLEPFPAWWAEHLKHVIEHDPHCEEQVALSSAHLPSGPCACPLVPPPCFVLGVCPLSSLPSHLYWPTPCPNRPHHPGLRAPALQLVP
mmetsp:Transcript_54079/g.136615  ORF Transcript_54079/g.136615 Transcript_54079/m.136615 type:complete len:223 (+) Transcript_54079:239-907(+)